MKFKIFILTFGLLCFSVNADQNDRYLQFRNELLHDKAIQPNFLQQKPMTNNIYYFISFSMPDSAIKQIMQESAAYDIPVFINGLIDDSMSVTMNKFIELFGDSSNFGVGIDPTLFTKFNVDVVPSLIVECDDNYDELKGNIPISQALEKIVESGDCAYVVQNIIGAK